MWRLSVILFVQWRIQGGTRVFEHPPLASTSLIIHYSQSTYDSLHGTAQLAPVPSEKTINGAASSRYALEVLYRSIERVC